MIRKKEFHQTCSSYLLFQGKSSSRQESLRQGGDPSRTDENTGKRIHQVDLRVKGEPQEAAERDKEQKRLIQLLTVHVLRSPNKDKLEITLCPKDNPQEFQVVPKDEKHDQGSGQCRITWCSLTQFHEAWACKLSMWAYIAESLTDNKSFRIFFLRRLWKAETPKQAVKTSSQAVLWETARFDVFTVPFDVSRLSVSSLVRMTQEVGWTKDTETFCVCLLFFVFLHFLLPQNWCSCFVFLCGLFFSRLCPKMFEAVGGKRRQASKQPSRWCQCTKMPKSNCSAGVFMYKQLCS